MRKGKVISLNFIGDSFKNISKNKILIIITFIFLLGLILGIFTFGKYEFVLRYTQNYLNDFIEKRESIEILKFFIDSIFKSIIFILISFCIGTSMFGMIVLIPLIMFRAFSYGSLVALLYSQYNIKGIAFNAVMILPYSIFFIIAFILSCCESLKFSSLYATQILRAGEYRNLTLYFKNYCIKHLLIMILILISAIIDSVISINFLKDFKLF